MKLSSLTAHFSTFLTGNTRIPVAFLQLCLFPSHFKLVQFLQMSGRERNVSEKLSSYLSISCAGAP